MFEKREKNKTLLIKKIFLVFAFSLFWLHIVIPNTGPKVLAMAMMPKEFVDGQIAAVQANKNNDNGLCVFETLGEKNVLLPDGQAYNNSSLWNCFEKVFYYILAMVAWILGFSVWLFNIVFEFTVIGMAETINKIGAISAVWKVFRDFTNILLIFILIYLAISTILGLNEHGVKHTLSKLVLIAILINFSMFFAKVVVDSSNILAISFYKKIQPSAETDNIADLFTKTYDGPSTTKGGIGGAFMASFQFQKLFADYKKGDAKGADMSGATAFAQKSNAGTIFLMGSIAMFFVFCIFLAATLIFIKRLVTIMILIMTSSLAFAGSLLHKTEGYAHEWWEKLIAESFYAPIFVAIIWITFHIMLDPNFQSTLNRKDTGFWFDIPTVVNYIIVINFFIMALVAGEKMGASGAGAAMGAYKKLKANLGGRPVQAAVRRTIGKAAYALYEGKDKTGTVGHGWRGQFKTGMEKMISKGGILGAGAGAVKSMLKAGVNAKVGEGNSFKEEFDEKQHGIAEALYEMRGEPAAQAEFLAEMTLKAEKDLNVRVALEKAWEAMKLDDQAEMMEQFDAKIKAAEAEGDTKEKARIEKAKNKLLGRLDPNQQDALKRKQEGALPVHRQRYDEMQKKLESTKEFKELDEEFEETQADGTKIKFKGLNGKREELTKKLDALKRSGADQADITKAENELKTVTTKIQDNQLKLRNSDDGVALRKYFANLNTKQQEGLSTEQLTNPMVADLIQGNLFEQLQRSGRLNEQNYNDLGSGSMDPQIKRLQEYKHAVDTNDLASKRAFRTKINAYLRSIGETNTFNESNDSTLDHAIEYYEEKMLPKDFTTGRVGKNMARYYGTEMGVQGEGIAQDAMKTRTQNRQTRQNRQSAASTSPQPANPFGSGGGSQNSSHTPPNPAVPPPSGGSQNNSHTPPNPAVPPPGTGVPPPPSIPPINPSNP